MARVVKFMARDRNSRLNTIKLSNGSFTNSGGETLAEMLKVHFPNSKVVSDPIIPVDLKTINCGRDKWTIAKKIVTYDRVFWAIMSFKPFKTPGMDGIFPALLQKSIKVLAPILCRIFRACIAFGYIPTAWRHTKVIFIPKVGKDNYFEAKSFRPICLTSFLLKTIEKFVDRYNRENMIGTFLFSDFQPAYQSGRFTDTALYCIS